MAVSWDDFEKIWASTSPLTPYAFSDDNYKNGWDFIGNTPPSRQMWDFLQKQNDEKAKFIVDNFLPLSGGTMTGAISTSSGGVAFRQVADDSTVRIFGGTSSDSANLWLFGKNSNGVGRFSLFAHDGTNMKELRGLADGTLMWNGQRIDNNIVDFKSSVTFNETPARSQFIKCGRIVTIMYQGESKAHSTNDVLFKIPTAYVPYDVSNLVQYWVVGTVNQTGMTFIISPNGNVTFGNSATGRAYIQVSYICE